MALCEAAMSATVEAAAPLLAMEGVVKRCGGVRRSEA